MKTSPMIKNHALVFGLIIYALSLTALAQGEEPALVSDLKVTMLSTMLTEFRGVGEWGFAALIEADGHSVLLDTGARPHTVLKNAKELGIDLSAVDDVILTHNHWDHAGGLVTLRRNMKDKNATALQTTHVGEGIFLPRSLDAEALSALPPLPQELLVDILDVREHYEALGGALSFTTNLTNCIQAYGSRGPSRACTRKRIGHRLCASKKAILSSKMRFQKIRPWSSTLGKGWS